jgi:hypothetical protein
MYEHVNNIHYICLKMWVRDGFHTHALTFVSNVRYQLLKAVTMIMSVERDAV